MRTVQDCRKPPEKRAIENTEQASWRNPKQVVPDETLHSKITGVGKAKRKTRRGKRGGVRRKMQNLQREKKKLEAAVGEWIKDIRQKIEVPQSDHAPSLDSTVDVLASDVDEMSITPSDVDPLYDYEHYFPEEVRGAANNVIDNRVKMQEMTTGSSLISHNVCIYHDNISTIAHAHGQLEMASGYENEAIGYGYGYECIGYGYGHECENEVYRHGYGFCA